MPFSVRDRHTVALLPNAVILVIDIQRLDFQIVMNGLSCNRGLRLFADHGTGLLCEVDRFTIVACKSRDNGHRSNSRQPSIYPAGQGRLRKPTNLLLCAVSLLALVKSFRSYPANLTAPARSTRMGTSE